MNRYTIGSGIRAAVISAAACSAFDPDLFMNTSTTDSNDTNFVPVPTGEFNAVIDEVKPGMAGDKPVLKVKWLIDDAEVREVTGQEKPAVTQTVWLDLTAGGGLDMGKGKNVGLGRLREALGQNTPGKPWGPGMLMGQVARVQISHRPGKEAGEIYADIKQVTAL